MEISQERKILNEKTMIQFLIVMDTLGRRLAIRRDEIIALTEDDDMTVLIWTRGSDEPFLATVSFDDMVYAMKGEYDGII